VSWEGKLQTDRQSQSQLRDQEGRLLFLDEDGEHTTDARGRVLAVRGGEPVYLAPPQALQHSGNAMPNRAGGGKGFTVAELDQLYIYDNYWGNRQFSNWPSRGEYLAEPSNRMMTSATRTAALEPTPQKPEYIEHCLSELDGLRREVESYRDQLLFHVSSLEQDIRGHLWITEEFVKPAAASLDGTQREVRSLLERIEKLSKGFALLPIEHVVKHGEPEDKVQVKAKARRRSSRSNRKR
jgi:MoxR-like ATPase